MHAVVCTVTIHDQKAAERTTRAVAMVPALRAPMEAFRGRLEAAADAIVYDWPERGARRQRVRAAVGHAAGRVEDPEEAR